MFFGVILIIMASISEFKNRIHIANCADLDTLKSQIDSYVTDNPSLLSNAIQHIYREFNKRKYKICGGIGMIEPYDAGFRPTSYTPSIGAGYILLENDAEILLENGENLLHE